MLGERGPAAVARPHAYGTGSRVWVRSMQDGEPRYDEAALMGEADGWAWWEAAMLVVNPMAGTVFSLMSRAARRAN